MLLFDFLKTAYRSKPGFFVLVILVFAVYGLQMVLRIEITPLGYFSLYSNTTPKQSAYRQILPHSGNKDKPLNIYRSKGTAFLMLEILPQRYSILRSSDHCNQMQHKLDRLGIKAVNVEDCERLDEFRQWFPVYCRRIGVVLPSNYGLEDYGFFNGIFQQSEPVQTENHAP